MRYRCATPAHLEIAFKTVPKRVEGNRKMKIVKTSPGVNVISFQESRTEELANYIRPTILRFKN